MNRKRNPKGWHMGRCPNDIVTDEYHVYARSWKKLIRQVEALTGMKCMAFDPGLQLQEVDGKRIVNGMSAQMPAWLAIRLVEKFQENKKL